MRNWFRKIRALSIFRTALADQDLAPRRRDPVALEPVRRHPAGRRNGFGGAAELRMTPPPDRTCGCFMTRLICIAAMPLLFTGAISNAEPQRDISQLDLQSATQTVTASALEIKVLYGLSPSNGVGILFGGRLVRFLTDSFFYGGGGFGGTLVGRPVQAGGFGYGGFIAGWEIKPKDKLSLDAMLLLGGGGGTPAPGDQAAGLVVEPSLNINWALVKGLRLGLTGGYLFLVGSSSLSGFTTGLKLETKSFNLSWPQ